VSAAGRLEERGRRRGLQSVAYDGRRLGVPVIVIAERGVHARGSAGVTEFPLSIAVDVEMVVGAVEAEERR